MPLTRPVRSMSGCGIRVLAAPFLDAFVAGGDLRVEAQPVSFHDGARTLAADLRHMLRAVLLHHGPSAPACLLRKRSAPAAAPGAVRSFFRHRSSSCLRRSTGYYRPAREALAED